MLIFFSFLLLVIIWVLDETITEASIQIIEYELI